MKIGTTLAHPHLKYLRLDLGNSLEDLKSLNLDIVRLGIYWNETEPENNKFDFSQIKELLNFCEKNHQDVVLTVGMKAPRWPEFYLPNWLKNKKPEETEHEVLRFIKTSINELSSYKCIKYWQVENEPLDPSGPKKLTIPYQILKKEVELIRSLDDRKITLNLWGNELTKRNLFQKSANLADFLGVDIYYKTPSLLGKYKGPSDDDAKLGEILSQTGKPFWISELQAEPWEKSNLVSYSPNPPSMNEEILRENFGRAKRMNPQVILLWGLEYWLLRKSKGDSRLWDAINNLIIEARNLTPTNPRRTIRL